MSESTRPKASQAARAGALPVLAALALCVLASAAASSESVVAPGAVDRARLDQIASEPGAWLTAGRDAQGTGH
jgi:hypothetical protein